AQPLPCRRRPAPSPAEGEPVPIPRSTHRSAADPRPAHPADAAQIASRLAQTHPGARTELDHRDAVELLVATVLSAQTTDLRVNQVTPELFSRWPDPAALAAAEEAEVADVVRPPGMGPTQAPRR